VGGRGKKNLTGKKEAKDCSEKGGIEKSMPGTVKPTIKWGVNKTSFTPMLPKGGRDPIKSGPGA